MKCASPPASATLDIYGSVEVAAAVRYRYSCILAIHVLPSSQEDGGLQAGEVT